MKPVLTSHKKYFFITSIMVLIGFGGCKTDTTYILTEDELKWMIYDNDQVIKFQSDSGKSRTYNVYGRWRGDGNASVTIGLVGDTTHLAPSGLYLLKNEGGFTVTVSWPHYPAKFTPTSMIALPDTVSGTPYTDVYVSSSISTDSLHTIKEVYYSKSTGVIKFIESSGEVWSLKH
jgi:hypothetical protein